MCSRATSASIPSISDRFRQRCTVLRRHSLSGVYFARSHPFTELKNDLRKHYLALRQGGLAIPLVQPRRPGLIFESLGKAHAMSYRPRILITVITTRNASQSYFYDLRKRVSRDPAFT